MLDITKLGDIFLFHIFLSPVGKVPFHFPVSLTLKTKPLKRVPRVNHTYEENYRNVHRGQGAVRIYV